MTNDRFKLERIGGNRRSVTVSAHEVAILTLALEQMIARLEQQAEPVPEYYQVLLVKLRSFGQ
jgi:hypothetical protein